MNIAGAIPQSDTFLVLGVFGSINSVSESFVCETIPHPISKRRITLADLSLFPSIIQRLLKQSYNEF